MLILFETIVYEFVESNSNKRSLTKMMSCSKSFFFFIVKAENLYDNNSECEDCECDSAYVNHDRSESVFDKSSDEEMSEMSCDNNPVFGQNKKKYLRGKEGGNLTTTNNYC